MKGEFKHFTGKLIFDLTLINGTNSNLVVKEVDADVLKHHPHQSCSARYRPGEIPVFLVKLRIKLA